VRVFLYTSFRLLLASLLVVLLGFFVPLGGFVPQSVAFPGDGDHLSMVQELVEGGGGGRHVADELAPVLLIDEYGLDLTGWKLTNAMDISADSLTIVGAGINPEGNYEAWIVRFSE